MLKTVDFLSEEKTVGTDVYDYWLEGRNTEHGPVDIKTIKSFTAKKKPSLFDDLLKGSLSLNLAGDLTKWLKETKIFNFDETVCYNINNMPDHAAEAELQKFYDLKLEPDMLGLPFNNTCVVTPDCAIMLNEILGKPNTYFYVLAVNMHGRIDMQWMSLGLVNTEKVISKAAELAVAVELIFVRTTNGKFKQYSTDNKSKNGLIKPIIQKAMGLIMQLNTPDRFIMEVAPIKTDVKSKKYIPRSHQRPEYIVLHPHVIRHYMKTESDTEGHARRGHERRAHIRRYPDDPIKFPKAHGKVIRIEAVWIGRTEAIIDDKQYRVIL